MKISELNTKSFLGGAGAAANSYVLINYEDNSTSEPVTYKASLQELGKAIANDLKLPTVTVSEGAITNFKVKGVSNGAYTETVVAAPTGGGGWIDDSGVAYTDEQENKYYGLVYSEVSSIPTLFAMTDSGKPEELKPLGYYDTEGSIMMTPVFINPDDNNLYTVNDSGEISGVTTWVNESGIAYTDAVTEATYKGVVYALNDACMPTLYEMGESTPQAIAPIGYFDETNSVKYKPVFLNDDDSSLYTIDEEETISAVNGLASTGYVTNAVNGLASTGYVTNAISGLASTGYVTSAISNRVRNTMLFIDNSGDFAYEENNIIYPMLSTPPNLDDTKCVVTVSTNGDLYYYDSIHDEYKLISSLQNNA